MSWILRMAWRDTRSSRWHLLLFATPVALGIGVLVAVSAFSADLNRAVELQSRNLLGSDLVVTSRQGLSEDMEAWLAEIEGERLLEITFASMLVHEGSGQSRLVSVRAVEPGFPFYGALETRPEPGAERMFAEGGVLIEESLLYQLGIEPGAEIRLGELRLPVSGALLRAPGESPAFGLVAPRVYLPMELVEATGLLQRGSRVNHRVHFRLPEGVTASSQLEGRRERMRELALSAETVRGRQVSLGRAFENLTRFLGLAGFAALLLGGLGVASGLAAFLRERRVSLAVLRCLGASRGAVAWICLVQAAGLGLAGAVAGGLLGLAVQQLFPWIFAGLLPVTVETQLPWQALAVGLAAGTGLTVLFSLPPLAGLRRMGPLLALRATVESPGAPWREIRWWLGGLVGLAGLVVLARIQAGNWQYGLGFTGVVAGVLLVLYLTGRSMMALLRRLRLDGAPFAWRQGVANLFRPNNRTALLVPVLGLGAFLLAAFALSQEMLLRQINQLQEGGRANLIIFDIQPDQERDLELLLEREGLSVIDSAPLVTMRLSSIKGVPVRELLRQEGRTTPSWMLTREYRSTYRAGPGPAERLVRGEMVPRVDPATEVVPVTLEQDLARDLGVDLGDRLVFDVQGVPVETEVVGLREVDWQRIQPNFFVVFPEGVLEGAPRFGILATRTEGAQQSAALQRLLVRDFPNLSIIDLTLILQTVDQVVEQISFVFRFMGGFLVGTGLFVLAGVLIGGRLQRMREAVLLRTLGSQRRQIGAIQTIEYALIGLLAGAAGLVLGWVGGWALGHFVFEIEGVPPIWPLLPAVVVITLLTTLTGWLTGARLLRHPPLELLREEGGGG
ncbi:MAG: FtsX-like permease family protein [Puniceicoccaceae bacterium]|nr:MAG: FtsX-like permease family protein [Puniceicoccaceae bacterium]